MQSTTTAFHKEIMQAIGEFYDTGKYFKENRSNNLNTAKEVVDFYFHKLPKGKEDIKAKFLDRVGNIDRELLVNIGKTAAKQKQTSATSSGDEESEEKTEREVATFMRDEEKHRIRKSIGLSILFMEKISSQRELIKRADAIRKKEAFILGEIEKMGEPDEKTKELLGVLDGLQEEKKIGSPEVLAEAERLLWGMNDNIMSGIPSEVLGRNGKATIEEIRNSDEVFSVDEKMDEVYNLERISLTSPTIQNTKKELVQIKNDYESEMYPEDLDNVMKTIFTSQAMIEKSLDRLEAVLDGLDEIIKEKNLEKEQAAALEKAQIEAKEREARANDEPPVPDDEDIPVEDLGEEAVIGGANGEAVEGKKEKIGVSWGRRQGDSGQREAFVLMADSGKVKYFTGSNDEELRSAGDKYMKELRKENPQIIYVYDKTPSPFPIQKVSPQQSPQEPISANERVPVSDGRVYERKTYLAVEFEKADTFKKETSGDKSKRHFDKDAKLWYVEPGAKKEFYEAWEHDKQGVAIVEPDKMEVEDAVAILEEKTGETFKITPQNGGDYRLMNSKGADAGVVLSEMDSGSIRIHFFTQSMFGIVNDGSKNIHPQKNGELNLFINPPYKKGNRPNGKGVVADKKSVFYKAREANEKLGRVDKQKNMGAEKKALQDEVAKKVEASLKTMRPADNSHPYLVSKKAGAHGIKMVTWNDPDDRQKKMDTLVIPFQNIDGDIRTCQYVFPKIIDGSNKKIRSGGEKVGSFLILGAESIPPNGKVWLTEGYATGASVYEALDEKEVVIVSIDSSNMKVVAEKIREKYPDVEMIVAGDNDKRTPEEQKRGLVNSGMLAAEHIKEKQGATCILPLLRGKTKTLAKEQDVRVSDFNDVVCLFEDKKEGLETVRELLLGKSPEKRGFDIEIEATQLEGGNTQGGVSSKKRM